MSQRYYNVEVMCIMYCQKIESLIEIELSKLSKDRWGANNILRRLFGVFRFAVHKNNYCI
jgi:hypothetical protein